MPVNDAKVVRIIAEDFRSLPERCPGYHDELIEAIGEIVVAERQHMVSRTNINQQVKERIERVGQFLVSNQVG